MLRTSLAAAAFALGTLALAQPSSAAGLTVDAGPAGASIQLVDWRLSPREIRWALRNQGYSNIRIIERQGRVYTAVAENYRGHDVVLRVSARSGNVLSVQRIGNDNWGHGGYGWGGGYGGYGYGWGGGAGGDGGGWGGGQGGQPGGWGGRGGGWGGGQGGAPGMPGY